MASRYSARRGGLLEERTRANTELAELNARLTSVEVEGVTAYPQPEIAQLAGGLAEPAAAQEPPTANPVPQGSPIRGSCRLLHRRSRPGTVIPPPSAPGAEAPNRPVLVTSVEVEGVTAYPQPEIAQLAGGLVGPAVPLPQIDAARQAIVQRYRADGYVLTTVAANLDKAGRLRLIVTEGRIASVRLNGDIGPAGDQVLRFLTPSHWSAILCQLPPPPDLPTPPLSPPPPPPPPPPVPTGTLGQQGYLGTTTVFGAALSYPVIRSRQQTLNVNVAFDALNSDISISPNGTPRTRASYDALRVLRLGGDYALSDLWLGADRSAVNLLSVHMFEGLKLLGASINGNSLTSPQLGEQTGFFKVNFEASRTQTLFTPWESASVGLMDLLTGQWSDTVLPPAEQFYLGGARFTRGYTSLTR